jgi:hypothetical protein
MCSGFRYNVDRWHRRIAASSVHTQMRIGRNRGDLEYTVPRPIRFEGCLNSTAMFQAMKNSMPNVPASKQLLPSSRRSFYQP